MVNSKKRHVKHHHLSRNSETDLALPKPQSNSLKRGFKYSGAVLWNNFPKETEKRKIFTGV